MTRPARRAIVLWLLALAACLAVIARSHFTADMSAFLPQSPTPEQQLLVDQLQEGVVSRTVLIGIEGADGLGRARLSRELADRLRKSGEFVAVRNGEAGGMDKDREILFTHRYLLSPAVTPERFTETGLRAAIGDSIDLLASPAGLMLKGLLPRDPTGEMMALLSAFEGSSNPPSREGVWASSDGSRAILMAQTRAGGSDTDGQAIALQRLQEDFDVARAAAGISDAQVVASGSPVFSVDSRHKIQSEVTRLSIVSTVAIVSLLLLVYRSLTALALGILPVVSGALAGVAAVSLGFGTVHGITIGFGTTLIGEAVDYTIYYFVQSQRQGGSADDWLKRFWPTIRLGVVTSTCGFASLLFSGFPGLAQLGLYSIAGLVAAALVTRFVVPHLQPANFKIRDIDGIGLKLAGLIGRLQWLRWPVVALAVGAVALVASRHDEIWNPGLSSLNPVSADAQAQDASLRGDLGAPDLRYLVVVKTPERETTLAAAEKIGQHLQTLVEKGVIAGFESPTRFLPSQESQRMRQAAIPEGPELQRRLAAALADLPLRPERLAPFLADVEAARQLPLVTPETMSGSSLALAVDAMLLHSASGWTALMPLRPLISGQTLLDIDAKAVQAELAAAGQPGALFIDLMGEFNRLYSAYLHEAILLSLLGFVAIALILAATLRSPARLLRILTPLVLSVILVIGGLTLAGEKLTLLHLIGMLLIVAVGSNYALFFDRGTAEDPHTLASLALANVATVIGFGALAFSQVPILKAMGITVGPGAVLALLLSAILTGRGNPVR